MPDTKDLIDWEHVFESVGGDEQLLKEITQVFLEEGPALLDQIRQSIANRQAAVLQRSAHTLKSNLRLFGNQTASKLAETLEQMGAAKTFDNAGTVLADLEQQFTRVLECLAERLSRQTP